jgi:hypothetical protein
MRSEAFRERSEHQHIFLADDDATIPMACDSAPAPTLPDRPRSPAVVRDWNYVATVQVGSVSMSSRSVRGVVRGTSEADARDVARAEILEEMGADENAVVSVIFGCIW